MESPASQTSSSFHCREAVQFPRGDLDQLPRLTLLILPEPVGLEVKGKFVVAPGRNTPCSETKISMVVGTGSQSFLVGH